jgi:hypothetical protein
VIVFGSLVVLAMFLLFGWIITAEMVQHRTWRKRVAAGDSAIVYALIEEALGAWRKARPPRGLPTQLWSAVQGAQLVAVTAESATLSASAEPAFRTEGGQRVQVSTVLDEAMAVAAKVVDMMLYDVPNPRLPRVRVDVFATFTGGDGAAVQRPILSTTAERRDAEALEWEALTPRELLKRFDTRFEQSANGQAVPIVLDPIEGDIPQLPGPVLAATGAA